MKQYRTIISFILCTAMFLSIPQQVVHAEDAPAPTPVTTESAEPTAEPAESSAPLAAASAEPESTPAPTPTASGETETSPEPGAEATAEASKEPEATVTAEPEAQKMIPAEVSPEELERLGYKLEEAKTEEYGFSVYTDGTNYYFYGTDDTAGAEAAWYQLTDDAWTAYQPEETADNYQAESAGIPADLTIHQDAGSGDIIVESSNAAYLSQISQINFVPTSSMTSNAFQRTLLTKTEDSGCKITAGMLTCSYDYMYTGWDEDLRDFRWLSVGIYNVSFTLDGSSGQTTQSLNGTVAISKSKCKREPDNVAVEEQTDGSIRITATGTNAQDWMAALLSDEEVRNDIEMDDATGETAPSVNIYAHFTNYAINYTDGGKTAFPVQSIHAQKDASGQIEYLYIDPDAVRDNGLYNGTFAVHASIYGYPWYYLPNYITLKNTGRSSCWGDSIRFETDTEGNLSVYSDYPRFLDTFKSGQSNSGLMTLRFSLEQPQSDGSLWVKGSFTLSNEEAENIEIVDSGSNPHLFIKKDAIDRAINRYPGIAAGTYTVEYDGIFYSEMVNGKRLSCYSTPYDEAYSFAGQKDLTYTVKYQGAPAINSITLNKDDSKVTVLKTGDQALIHAVTDPEDNGGNPINYKISDESVCSVKYVYEGDTIVHTENAEVTALKPGVCRITAYITNNQAANKTKKTSSVIQYTVVNALNSIRTALNEVSLQAGASYTIPTIFDPAASVDKNLTYTVDAAGKDVVSVSAAGVVKGLAKGTAVITVASASQPDKSYQVTVKVSPVVKSLVMNDAGVLKSTQDLMLGDTRNLAVTVTTTSTVNSTTEADEYIAWSSSNEDAVKVVPDPADNTKAVLTATGAGKSTVTISAGSKKLTYQISVHNIDPSLKLTAKGGDYKDPSTGTVTTFNPAGMESGAKITCEVYAGENQVDPSKTAMTFTSSNPSAAAVDANGIVTFGDKAGTATIKAAITNDPKNRTVSITVKTIAPQVKSITLTRTDSNSLFASDNEESINEIIADYQSVMKTGADRTFQFAWEMTGGTDDRPLSTKVKWTSSDNSVASVDGSGKVTVKKAGEVVLTITAQDVLKNSSTVALRILDYAPTLETASYTLNRNNFSGIEFKFTVPYDEPATSAKSWLGNTLDSNFDTDGVSIISDGNQFAITDNKTDTAAATAWYLNFKDTSAPAAKGTYPVTFLFKTAKGLYEVSAKITVVDTLPKVKISSYEGSVNAFYKSGNEIRLTMNTQGYSIADGSISLSSSTDPNFSKNFTAVIDKGVITITPAATLLNKTGAEVVTAADAKTVTWKGILSFRLDDFGNHSFTVNVSIPNKYRAPEFLLLGYDDGYGHSIGNSLINQVYGTYPASFTDQVDIMAGFADDYAGNTMSNKITLAYSEDTSKEIFPAEGLVKAKVTDYEPEMHVSITSKAAGTATIIASDPDEWNGTITLKYQTKSTTAKPAYGIYQEMKKVSAITLTNNSVSPYIEATINPVYGKNSYTTFANHLGDNGGNAAPVKPTGETAKMTVTMNSSKNTDFLYATATITDSSIKAGSYAYTYTPKDAAGSDLPPVTFTVKVVSQAMKLNAKVSGSINPIDRAFDSTSAADLASTTKYVKVVVNLTGANDANINPGNLSLEGTDSDKFEITELHVLFEDSYAITAKEGADLTSGKTYALTLKAAVTGMSKLEYVTQPISIKVIQVLPRVTVTGSKMMMYNRFSSNNYVGEADFSFQKAAATVSRLEVLNGDTGYRCEPVYKNAGDSTSPIIGVKVYVEDSSRIKAGSTTSLKLRLNYADAAVNKAAYSDVIITVTDRTSGIKSKISELN